MEKNLIDKMVDRFLCWKLPNDFAPDCGIGFDGRRDDEWNKNKTWPVGTNLFTADQARQMFEDGEYTEKGEVMAELPRLLEDGRVEVKICGSSTHIFVLERLDALIAHLQAARNLLAPKGFGCYCGLMDGETPDGCVTDTGDYQDCTYAEMGFKKEDCEYWRVIA